jgi:hypothetical protein
MIGDGWGVTGGAGSGDSANGEQGDIVDGVVVLELIDDVGEVIAGLAGGPAVEFGDEGVRLVVPEHDALRVAGFGDAVGVEQQHIPGHESVSGFFKLMLVPEDAQQGGRWTRRRFRHGRRP